MLKTLDFCGFHTSPEIAANWSKIERRVGLDISREDRKKKMSSANTELMVEATHFKALNVRVRTY